MNPIQNDSSEQNLRLLKNGETAIVEMIPQKEVCVESMNTFPSLARFVIRERKKAIVGSGVILSVQTEKIVNPRNMEKKNRNVKTVKTEKNVSSNHSNIQTETISICTE